LYTIYRKKSRQKKEKQKHFYGSKNDRNKKVIFLFKENVLWNAVKNTPYLKMTFNVSLSKLNTTPSPLYFILLEVDC